MIRRRETRSDQRRRTRKVSWTASDGKWWLAIACAIAVACGGESSTPFDPARANLQACSQGTALFSTPPIALTSVAGWVPLGNLNPPGHTFPTDHQYLYLPTGARSPVDLFAPGNALITRARRTSYSRGGSDYAIELSPCREVRAELGHVMTIAPALLARLGAFNQQCDTYSPDPSTTVTTCYTPPIAVSVEAGEVIGSTMGLDFSMFDSRVTALEYANPSRWRTNQDGFDSFHVVAASDYFSEPARSQIAEKLGSFDGRVRRTAAPVGGTIEVDVAGSAQGMWFNPSQPTYPESPHLAIAPDNVDPSRVTVSIGTSQPLLNSRYFTFAPTTSGPINRHPSQVTADGQTYCYDLQIGNVMLLRMMDANTLRAEMRVGNAITCATLGSYAFTNGAVFEYVR